MRWFEGSIPEAVQTTKEKKAVFVVFIDGKDETSRLMSSAIDKPALSEHLETDSFVSVKLESGTESHNQFTEIYKLVPVPSVFFIGENGAPLEIVAGENSEENIVSKLEAAIKKCIGINKPTSVNCKESPGPSSTASSSESEVRPNSSLRKEACPTQSKANGSECVPTMKEESGKQTSPSTSSMTNQESSSSLAESETSQKLSPRQESSPMEPELGSAEFESNVQEESVKTEPASSHSPAQATNSEALSKDQIMAIVEKKKEERKALEEKEENEREIERRRIGQSMMGAKRKQQELDLQNLRSERLKEKQMEREAKQRVLDQIAQDRAERAARMAISQGSSSQASPPVVEQPRRVPPVADMSSARLQFKLPDGQTRNHTFPAETTLGQVRQFIDNNIVLPFREYQMATTFPRREFNHRDINSDLRELQLLPTSVILIMPFQGSLSVASGPGWPRMFIDMLWDLIQPLLSFSSYLKSLVFRGGDSGQRPTQPPPSSTPQPPPSSSSTRSTQHPIQQPPLTRSFVRKRGNIHSLADSDNSNDENNTWNGNSTQQM